MTETERFVQRLHWIFDENSHKNKVTGVYQCGDEIQIELSDHTKNFTSTRFLGVYDLMEQICKGIDEADNWRKY